MSTTFILLLLHSSANLLHSRFSDELVIHLWKTWKISSYFRSFHSWAWVLSVWKTSRHPFNAGFSTNPFWELDFRKLEETSNWRQLMQTPVYKALTRLLKNPIYDVRGPFFCYLHFIWSFLNFRIEISRVIPTPNFSPNGNQTNRVLELSYL